MVTASTRFDSQPAASGALGHGAGPCGRDGGAVAYADLTAGSAAIASSPEKNLSAAGIRRVAGTN